MPYGNHLTRKRPYISSDASQSWLFSLAWTHRQHEHGTGPQTPTEKELRCVRKCFFLPTAGTNVNSRCSCCYCCWYRGASDSPYTDTAGERTHPFKVMVICPVIFITTWQRPTTTNFPIVTATASNSGTDPKLGEFDCRLFFVCRRSTARARRSRAHEEKNRGQLQFAPQGGKSKDARVVDGEMCHVTTDEELTHAVPSACTDAHLDRPKTTTSGEKAPVGRWQTKK